jgi:hypothetical protein
LPIQETCKILKQKNISYWLNLWILNSDKMYWWDLSNSLLVLF